MTETINLTANAEAVAKPDVQNPGRLNILKRLAAKAIVNSEQITGLPVMPANIARGTSESAPYMNAATPEDPFPVDAAVAKADKELKANARVV